MTGRIVVGVMVASSLVANALPANAEGEHAERMPSSMRANDPHPAPSAVAPARDMSFDQRLRPHRRSIREQLEVGATALGDEMNQHLGGLSLGLIGVRINGHDRTADLRLGVADGNRGAMLDGHVTFSAGRARIDARLVLQLMGMRLQLDLPDVELVPTSDLGRHYLQVQVPIFEHTL